MNKDKETEVETLVPTHHQLSDSFFIWKLPNIVLLCRKMDGGCAYYWRDTDQRQKSRTHIGLSTMMPDLRWAKPIKEKDISFNLVTVGKESATNPPSHVVTSISELLAFTSYGPLYSTCSAFHKGRKFELKYTDGTRLNFHVSRRTVEHYDCTWTIPFNGKNVTCEFVSCFSYLQNGVKEIDKIVEQVNFPPELTNIIRGYALFPYLLWTIDMVLSTWEHRLSNTCVTNLILLRKWLSSMVLLDSVDIPPMSGLYFC
jgi:hypothetical protein